MYRCIGFIGGLCVAASAMAEPVAMTGKAISDSVVGAMVRLDTPLGTSLPVKYAANGLISGEAGGLAWFLGSSTDRGRWWVAEDKLCHKWFKWFDAEVQCLRLKRDGEHLYWSRDDGKTGTATLLAAAPIEAAPFALGNPVKAQVVAAAPVVQAAETSAAPDATVMPPLSLSVAPAPAKAPSTAVKPNTASKPHVKQMGRPLANAKVAPTVQAKVALAAVVTPSLAAAKAPSGQSRSGVADALATASPPHAALVSFRVAGVHPSDVLNVRQGPSSDAPPVGIISPQAQGVRLSGACQMEWCPVTHGAVRGWVNRYYLMQEN